MRFSEMILRNFENTKARERILTFLAWNDKNASFLDEDVLKEGNRTFTLEESIKLFCGVTFNSLFEKDADNILELDFNYMMTKIIDNERIDEFITKIYLVAHDSEYIRKSKLEIFKKTLE